VRHVGAGHGRGPARVRQRVVIVGAGFAGLNTAHALCSVKPIGTQTLLAAAAGDRIVVAEDHYPAGGLGSAILATFNEAGHPVRVSHLAVRDLPAPEHLPNSWRRPGSWPARSTV
jgi:glycine/D-amino acid oxidase-like deaminating enzyme